MSASILFDTPGPKARRRILAVNIIGALIALGIVAWIILGLAAKDQMQASQALL